MSARFLGVLRGDLLITGEMKLEISEAQMKLEPFLLRIGGLWVRTVSISI